VSRQRCRHCLVKYATRARGLCWTCSLDPAVRALHPLGPRHPCDRRGIEDFNGRAKPCVPTRAQPNTPEKLTVLAERAARGEALFHPADARRDDEERSAA
jgi:hypothetical protein